MTGTFQDLHVTCRGEEFVLRHIHITMITNNDKWMKICYSINYNPVCDSFEEKELQVLIPLLPYMEITIN